MLSELKKWANMQGYNIKSIEGIKFFQKPGSPGKDQFANLLGGGGCGLHGDKIFLHASKFSLQRFKVGFMV